MKISMEEFTNYLRHQGFVYQGSEIYGGLANTWDYGPLGVELLNHLKQLWWKAFVYKGGLNVGMDSSIIISPEVWKASGHLASFSDPLTDCKKCGTRHRADKLIEDATHGEVSADGWEADVLFNYLKEHQIACPSCGTCDYTPIRNFNLMFKTNQGVIDDDKNIVYLRPETAQGLFVNFKNVLRTSRKKIPFGIAQIGKSFRNEITPGNFIFRTREFEQAELEFFCKPGTDLEWFKYWKNYCWEFLLSLGIDEANLRFRDHTPEELSFYSKATTDIEYNYSFGWGELWGIADRTDYDLKVHEQFSGESMEYFDPDTDEHYLPYVVEPSLGVNRLFLAVLNDAYHVEQLEDDERIVLKLDPRLAPVKVAVLPLTNKLREQAEAIYQEVSEYFAAQYDTSGKIGRRYRRQDSIGTPFCITVDFDTLEDGTVTLRNRDTMEQVRMTLGEAIDYINRQTRI